MKLHLHKNATTTPAQREFIQNAPHLSVSQLAEKIGVSKTTVQRWRKRSDVFDRSHTPKSLNTVLSPMDEIKIILCRLITRTGLDDLHKIVKSFLGVDCSRASLNRCLKRYGISRLPRLGHAVPYDLKDYSGTYLFYNHFQLPGFSDSSSPVFMHTLLDCSFRILIAEPCLSGQKFLSRHIREFPLRILGIIYEDPIILTSAPEVHQHGTMVESLCQSHKIIAHHLESQTPQTTQHLKQTCTSLKNTGAGFSWEIPWSSTIEFAEIIKQYNRQFSLGALKQQTPRQALTSHYTHFPNSFRQKPEAYA